MMKARTASLHDQGEGNMAGVSICQLKVQAGAEQGDEGHSGQQRHQQQLLARRLAKGHAPAITHAPTLESSPSVPTISRKRSSSDLRSGVSS